MSPAYSRTGYPVTYCIQGIHRYTSSHSRMSRPEQRYRPSRQNWNTSFFCNQGTRDIDIYNPEYAGRLGIGAADAYLALAEDQGIAPQAVDTLYSGNTSGVVDVTWQISADEDDGKPFQYLVCWSEDPLGQLDPGRLPEEVA